MALKHYSGFETGDFGEWSSTTGSPTVVEANGWGAPKTGDYCMRCNTDAAAVYAQISGGSDDFGRIAFHLYISSLPISETIIAGVYTAIPTLYTNVRLTSDGYLKLYYGDTLKDTGSTQLQIGTWNRISWGHTTGCRVYLNGISELYRVSGMGVSGNLRLGIISSETADLYVDDFSCDDIYSQDDPDDIRVLRSSPNAAGAHAEFDTISGYENCDEVPADGATTIVDDSGVGAMHRETYNLQDHDTIGIGASDTWVGVNVWVQGYDASQTAQGITVRDDGTDYETLAQWGKAYTWKNKLYFEAPRASAWTKEIFDAFQAGCYSEGSKDVYVSSVMVMVAFIPEEAPPPEGQPYISRVQGVQGMRSWGGI